LDSRIGRRGIRGNGRGMTGGILTTERCGDREEEQERKGDGRKTPAAGQNACLPGPGASF
ncbi:MAG: hypothetical protein M8862_10505, partial [marine benthic group bacterium]|nr:hypothetical protein [Gemmatimonadota bacterium]